MSMTDSDTPVEYGSSERPLIKQGWLRALIFYVAFVAFTIAIGIAGGLILAISSGNGFSPNFDSLGMTVLEACSVLGSFLLILLFRKLIDRESVMSLGFSLSSRYARDFAGGVLLGILLQTVMFGFLWLTGQIQVVGFGFAPASLITVLFTLIFAAIQEEIVMRGYMLNNLMQSANKYLSLLLVSVVFALMHGLNPDVSIAGIVNIILAGLLLGIYYVHRKNLWFPIGLHIAWNYMEGPVLGSPVSGVKLASIVRVEFTGNPIWTGGSFGFEASYALSILMVLAIAAVHLMYRSTDGATVLAGRAETGQRPSTNPE